MSVYLREMSLPGEGREISYFQFDDKMKLNDIYDSFYPFKLFTKYSTPPTFTFAPVTIFYGGNGSGKSTILNVIAQSLGLERHSMFSGSDFFQDYCKLCGFGFERIPMNSKIITSDDIFKKMSDVRGVNQINDQKRREIWDRKIRMLQEIGHDPTVLHLKGLDDYDRLSAYREVINSSTSQFIRARVQKNLTARSNGETALRYLADEIGEDALYLLDEPENSLSPGSQLKLKEFIEESAQYFRCQFIISTHSPLLLAMDQAKIYDLDDECTVKEWYELETAQVYAEFFKNNLEYFDQPT